MDEKIISDFMTIGSDSFEDADSIFRLTIDYLLKIKESEYTTESSVLIEGFLNKMITIGEKFDLNESLLAEIQNASNSFVSIFGNQNHREAQRLPHFGKVTAVSMKFINAMKKIEPQEKIDFGPFQPKKSDKSMIIEKLNESIELIDSSELINKKTKEKLKSKINKVIYDLNEPNRNWDNYFRTINQTILFLGAVSTIATNIIGVQNIIESKEKLEEANLILQKTSISINHNDIKEVFVVKNNFSLDTGSIMKLEEKN